MDQRGESVQDMALFLLFEWRATDVMECDKNLTFQTEFSHECGFALRLESLQASENTYFSLVKLLSSFRRARAPTFLSSYKQRDDRCHAMEEILAKMQMDHESITNLAQWNDPVKDADRRSMGR